MDIRKLEPGDFSAVCSMMQELHNLHVEGRPDIYVFAKEIYSEEQFLEMLSSGEKFAIGAEENGKLAGICFFEIRKTSAKSKKGVAENTVAFINDIVVSKKFRRKGAAKLLFEKAEEIAKENGAKRIDLMVWNFNKDAIEFYNAMGMDVQRFVFEKKI